MSVSIGELTKTTAWVSTMWQEAVASIAGPSEKIVAQPMRLRLATEREQEKYGAAVVAEFETTGKHASVAHHEMSDILKKLGADLAQHDALVLGTNVVQSDRHIVRFPTDDEPGPLCYRHKKCDCCGGMYVDSERYCKFMLYFGESEAASESVVKKARVE